MSTYRVALIGNPNTGKSTLFNALTGLRQHTGNWAGKTVVRAEGEYEYNGHTYNVIDLPGTYSLFSNSVDEEVARDYIVLDRPDVTVIVLDATAMERNMNLALQVLEMTSRAVVCLNLIDEAGKLGIEIREQLLAEKLGVPVVKISARNNQGIPELLRQIENVAERRIVPKPVQVKYSEEIERRIQELEPEVRRLIGDDYPARWIALRLLDGDDSIIAALERRLGANASQTKEMIADGLSCAH
jgi:small GTP-binding protein domain